MKWDNYKSLKKADWQEIAKQFDIPFEDWSVVRYLVEKVAEKLGIDDKIVSDNELKKQVFDKLKSDYELVPLDDNSEIKDESDSESQEDLEKNNDVKTEESDEEIKKESDEEEFLTEKIEEEEEKPVQLSRLEQLRLECESYGVAWSEIHTEQNLEQVLNGVKSAGVLPIKDVATATSDSNHVLNTNAEFEINSDNANEIQNSVINAPINNGFNPAFNPLSAPTEPPVNGGYKSSNAYLNTYAGIYLNAIRNHFRLLTINEINEMINRDKQTFSHHINTNPQQSNKIEIFLVQGSDKVRIPAETNEWIDING
jgi:hypothetical protein